MGQPLQTFRDSMGFLIFAAVPDRVGLQSFTESRHVESIMRRNPGRTRYRRRSAHHVRITNRPFISLLRTHRPAEHKRDLADSEVLRQQAVLRTHVIGNIELGKCRHTVGSRRIMRRTGQAVAELVRNHNEIPAWVKRKAFADVMLQAPART